MRAFTLVETLVAIAILLIAISGPLYAIQKAVTAAYTSRDQLTASALAQEGLEYLYAIRNNNFLSNSKDGTSLTWFAGIDGTPNAAGVGALCTAPHTCGVNPFTTPDIVACGTGACPALALATNGRYSQEAGGGPITKFSRTFSVTFDVPSSPALSTEAVITITVSWQSNGVAHSTVLKERLRNWL